MNGIQVFLDQLAEFGVRYVFGNPGTTELPLNDALVEDRRLQYILGLQEVPVMAMADGYAMASRSLAVVNLHISCGVGNAMGMLYNAYREGTPLLVTAGQQDRRLQFEEPILWGDLVGVTRAWTKWSCEVQRVEDLPTAVRRAAQAALTPPTGPVFLSLPVDVQMAAADHVERAPIQIPDTRTRPSETAVQHAVDALRSARSPCILAGSRVCERDAVQALVELAERWGAVVLSESGTTHGRLPFPADHPLNGQGLPLWSPEVRERLADFDVVLVVGMDLLRQYVYYEPSRAIPEHVRLVHLDEDPWQLGKNYPVEVGVLGDIRESLRALAAAWDGVCSDADRAAARQRRDQWQQKHEAEREALRARVEAESDARPMTPLAAMGAVAAAIPPDVAVVEEAVTTTNTTLERLGALRNTTGYFGHRGWGLGWGLGCAIGAKLAWPERPVLALLGEGAALYGIQGLWSAARYQIPVTFVIFNNSQYQILKIGARGLKLPHAERGEYVGLDLDQPEIDFLGLAAALGVSAERISEPAALTDRLHRSLSRHELVVLEVPIQRQTPGRLNYGS